MERQSLSTLTAWKSSPYRKPLIVQGVRQVGKTWLIMHFGQKYYQNTVRIAFDEHPEYKQFFETTKDPRRIIPNLSIACSQPIHPENTLLFFDEIQECPEALNALKYFCEDAPQYHVICAGSLLSLTLAQPASFPVGKVNFLTLYPMTFNEYLGASDSSSLATYLKALEKIEPLPDAFFNPLCEKLKMYFICGGLPEPLRLMAEEHDVPSTSSALSDILKAYAYDMTKHAALSQFPRIQSIWNSLPSQLSRENKKFKLSALGKNARNREYSEALQWLLSANMVYRVCRCSEPRLPLSAYADHSAFKLFSCDVGLLRQLSQLDPMVFKEGSRLFTEFKGALTENYILQALLPQLKTEPYYWAQNNPPYEVDFLVQQGNDVFPVEVKAATSVHSRSLVRYKEKFGDTVKLRVRFSLQNLRLDGDLLNIPLFLADETCRLIALALEQRRE